MSVQSFRFTDCRNQAIVRHEGSTSFSGHYKTAVKGVVSSDLSAPFRTDQIWRMHDDARVSEIPSSALVNEDAQRGAYLLFYVLKEG